MGVYIKGMKMPKDCNTCYISDCLLPYSKVVPIGYRHKDCPLVEVAEPHGRLVDFEEVEVTTYIDADGEHIETSAPTVIESEE